jgi:hypothetical protein
VVQRCEREHPGDLLHLDVKKFGRLGRVADRIIGDAAARLGEPYPDKISGSA